MVVPVLLLEVFFAVEEVEEVFFAAVEEEVFFAVEVADEVFLAVEVVVAGFFAAVALMFFGALLMLKLAHHLTFDILAQHRPYLFPNYDHYFVR